MKNHPSTGKNAASSNTIEPRMNPPRGVNVLPAFFICSPRCAAMPAEPIEESAREAASKIQPVNLAGPNGSARRMIRL